MQDIEFLKHAVNLAKENVEKGGRPFGAVIVYQGEVVSTGVNQILAHYDPTSHAELNAVRQACQKLQRLSLKDCVVYASGQPCPMCLAAMRMVGVEKIVYAYSNLDAEPYGLSTEQVAVQLRQPPQQQSGLQFIQLKLDIPFHLYQIWQQKQQFK